MKNTIIIVVIVALLALGGWYYMSTQNAPASNDTTQTVDQGASSPATGADANALPTGPVKEFTVTGSNYAFAPATLSVQKGDHVKITFVNSGGMHDFVIDGFNVRTKTVQSGAQDVVEFDATQSGTFEYYCSVGNHRAMGMKGTLTVTE